MDRRAIAALVLCLGLVGFWVVEGSSGFLWPAAWKPGSLAGQLGPEGSTWLGVGDEARHRNLIVRVTRIDDLPCPDSTEDLPRCKFRVWVDLRSTEVGRQQVVLLFGSGAEASEADVWPYRIRLVDISARRDELAWQGAALLITG